LRRNLKKLVKVKDKTANLTTTEKNFVAKEEGRIVTTD
jgi:hypothetical protein